MILVGTSGYSYKDWVGVFYPPDTSKKMMLNYYAKHFNTVEVNSTYYALPTKRLIDGLISKGGPKMIYSIKAHQEITHIRGNGLEILNDFLDRIQPLVDKKKLGCILFQFPWSFVNNSENRKYLYLLRQEALNYPVVVEFRNVSWAKEPVFKFLEELNYGYCCVDQPRLKGLMPPIVRVTSNIGYIRFHGRNAKNWWKHNEPHERYDYLYSEEELKEWVPKILEMESKCDKVFVYMNNHYLGKAVKNAKMLISLLKSAKRKKVKD